MAKQAKPTVKKRKFRCVPAGITMRWQGMSREIESIREYLLTVTSSFRQSFTSYEKHLQKRAAFASEDEMQDIGADWSQAKSEYLELFPAFALQTTFVATYTLLEDELCEIAREVGRHLKVELDPEDLGDKGIHAAKKFFQKVCGITITGEPNWGLMVQYGKLRNVCAHRRGRVKESSEDIRKYVAGKGTRLSINERHHLQFTHEFLLEVLDAVEAFLGGVYRLAQHTMMDE